MATGQYFINSHGLDEPFSTGEGWQAPRPPRQLLSLSLETTEILPTLEKLKASVGSTDLQDEMDDLLRKNLNDILRLPSGVQAVKNFLGEMSLLWNQTHEGLSRPPTCGVGTIPTYVAEDKVYFKRKYCDSWRCSYCGQKRQKKYIEQLKDGAFPSEVYVHIAFKQEHTKIYKKIKRKTHFYWCIFSHLLGDRYFFMTDTPVTGFTRLDINQCTQIASFFLQPENLSKKTKKVQRSYKDTEEGLEEELMEELKKELGEESIEGLKKSVKNFSSWFFDILPSLPVLKTFLDTLIEKLKRKKEEIEKLSSFFETHTQAYAFHTHPKLDGDNEVSFANNDEHNDNFYVKLGEKTKKIFRYMIINKKIVPKGLSILHSLESGYFDSILNEKH